jgi:2'-5' RNA ligase
MHIGFAIIPSDEVHNYTRDIELELCDKFGLCWGLRQSPHITIKPPFEVQELYPFIKYIDNLAANLKPFEIEICGFNLFPELNVIYLDVRENNELRKLREGIRDDLKEKFGIKPNKFEGDEWRFHISIALKDVTKEKLQKALNYLNNKPRPSFKFMLNTLGVFYYLGEEAGWIIIKRIKLHSK